MALPCSVMCQSGIGSSAGTRVLHLLAYTARPSIDCCSFVVMIEIRSCNSILGHLQRLRLRQEVDCV